MVPPDFSWACRPYVQMSSTVLTCSLRHYCCLHCLALDPLSPYCLCPPRSGLVPRGANPPSCCGGQPFYHILGSSLSPSNIPRMGYGVLEKSKADSPPVGAGQADPYQKWSEGNGRPLIRLSGQQAECRGPVADAPAHDWAWFPIIGVEPPINLSTLRLLGEFGGCSYSPGIGRVPKIRLCVRNACAPTSGPNGV